MGEIILQDTKSGVVPKERKVRVRKKGRKKRRELSRVAKIIRKAEHVELKGRPREGGSEGTYRQVRKGGMLSTALLQGGRKGGNVTNEATSKSSRTGKKKER